MIGRHQLQDESNEICHTAIGAVLFRKRRGLNARGLPLRLPVPSLLCPVLTRERQRLAPSRGNRTSWRPAAGPVRSGLHPFRRGLGHFRRDPGHCCRGRALPRPDPTRFRPGLTLFRGRSGFACRNPAGYAVDSGGVPIDSGLVGSVLYQTRASLPWSCPNCTRSAPSLPIPAADFTTTAYEAGNSARETAKSTLSYPSRDRRWQLRMRNAPDPGRTKEGTPRTNPATQRKRS